MQLPSGYGQQQLLGHQAAAWGLTVTSAHDGNACVLPGALCINGIGAARLASRHSLPRVLPTEAQPVWSPGVLVPIYLLLTALAPAGCLPAWPDSRRVGAAPSLARTLAAQLAASCSTSGPVTLAHSLHNGTHPVADQLGNAAAAAPRPPRISSAAERCSACTESVTSTLGNACDFTRIIYHEPDELTCNIDGMALKKHRFLSSRAQSFADQRLSRGAVLMTEALVDSAWYTAREA